MRARQAEEEVKCKLLVWSLYAFVVVGMVNLNRSDADADEVRSYSMVGMTEDINLRKMVIYCFTSTTCFEEEAASPDPPAPPEAVACI